MAVTAQMVKELREMTGAGMMDCKKLSLNQTEIWIRLLKYLEKKVFQRQRKKPEELLQWVL